ncbi:hypothetical protein OS493_039048, partial [Desmophyllum pertusum]
DNVETRDRCLSDLIRAAPPSRDQARETNIASGCPMFCSLAELITPTLICVMTQCF